MKQWYLITNIKQIIIIVDCFIGTKALQDAEITYDKIEQAFVGYVFGNFNKRALFFWTK